MELANLERLERYSKSYYVIIIYYALKEEEPTNKNTPILAGGESKLYNIYIYIR